MVATFYVPHTRLSATYKSVALTSCTKLTKCFPENQRLQAICPRHAS